MKSKILAVVGLGLLGFGVYGQFFGASVSAEAQARCEAIVTQRAAGDQAALNSLLPSCSDPGMVAMMDAQAANASAQDAAAAIAGANQADVGNSMLYSLMMGLGIALLAGGVFASRRRS